MNHDQPATRPDHSEVDSPTPISPDRERVRSEMTLRLRSSVTWKHPFGQRTQGGKVTRITDEWIEVSDDVATEGIRREWIVQVNGKSVVLVDGRLISTCPTCGQPHDHVHACAMCGRTEMDDGKPFVPCCDAEVERDPLDVVDERRREALTRICTEAAQLRLPMPMSIDFTGSSSRYPGIQLRLDEGQRDGVHAWAGHLGIEIEPERLYDTKLGDRPWVRVSARRDSYDEPFWLDFVHVKVWCSCPAGGDQS